MIAFAVANVSDDRLRDVLEMPADLMRSTGSWPGFVQSVTFEAPEEAKLRNGITPLGSRRFGERMLDPR